MHSSVTVNGQYWFLYLEDKSNNTEVSSNCVIPGLVSTGFYGAANMSVILNNTSTKSYSFRTYTSSYTSNPYFEGTCTLTRLA